CVIRKLVLEAGLYQPVKFTKKSLIDTLRAKEEGKTSYQARKIAKVSTRRVDTLWKEYLTTGEIPVIGNGVGRPVKVIEQWEKDLVKRLYEKYRVSADTLERLIERDEKIHMSHYRIHAILLELGYAEKKDKKDVRKKDWIRYERMHSLTAVHIDWHYTGRVWVFAVIDDASRKMLGMIECNSPTTKTSIEGMELAMKHGKIRQVISDHGSQFMNNMNGYSEFQEFLKLNEIKHIKCKIKHPQSNGKVERWFDCYERHRKAFKNQEDFLKWYNEVRPHRSLNFDVLETPEQAFIRKRRKE
ncbi:MAG TPA: DDE-type integrase/transposase/recombinase, partial [Candidatus Nanoarchaeia archaeon]|nr:DDE-type integrase/transposase/recombinase [Candidatus Nanoarchaeia archaeon]